MNTTEVKRALYERFQEMFDPPLTQEDVSRIVDTMTDVMEAAVTEEGHLLLRGFGTFLLTTRAGRAYNVRGEVHEVPERDTVVFKPGTSLKRKLSDE